jgi:hypothetical protein
LEGSAAFVFKDSRSIKMVANVFFETLGNTYPAKELHPTRAKSSIAPLHMPKICEVTMI